MRGVVMHAPGDVRVEERPDPEIQLPTDAIIRVTATCICGSDLWPYRGHDRANRKNMGHEYIGVVTEIGADVTSLAVGDHERQHVRNLRGGIPVALHSYDRHGLDRHTGGIRASSARRRHAREDARRTVG